MRLQKVITPITSDLTIRELDIKYSRRGRYNIVSHLLRAGRGQISTFLDRASLWLKAIEGSHAVFPEISLVSVFAHPDGNESGELPIFDFFGLHSGEFAGPSLTDYGVMFSTYLHDLDRPALELPGSKPDPHIISCRLVDALFFPSALNAGDPPFPAHFPRIILPASQAKCVSGRSKTEDYMMALGFNVNETQCPGGQSLRLFRHCKDVTAGCTSSRMSHSILALGQVCAEVTSASTAAYLKPLDRSCFTPELRETQARTIHEWINKNAAELRECVSV
jgi:hypothetical protein